ncbi:SurA N-terminal domain-containing protein [Bacillus sp. FJAT-45037]|uniref:SurA N-terminal domain-containing protein n=1 Tax=Bacillus sp. FJAT-45037 TaxID=2011007 RepID=UPI0012FD7FE2|nr:SurA N-terminal domain-containing protein [Bacillus sp. FJAT-45037]
MKKRLGLGMATIALAITLVACGDNEETTEVETESPDDATEETVENPEMEAPDGVGIDTEDVPDVVATVNGEDIHKEEYVRYLEEQAMMYTQFGISFDDEEGQAMLNELKDHALQVLINTELIVQAASDIEVSEEEVNEELDNAIEQAPFETKEELEEHLSEQGITLDDIREDIRKQLKIEQYIAANTDAPEITEEELQAAYDEQVAFAEENGSEEEIPSFEEQRDQLQAELEQEALAVQQERILEELLEESEVETNV